MVTWTWFSLRFYGEVRATSATSICKMLEASDKECTPCIYQVYVDVYILVCMNINTTHKQISIFLHILCTSSSWILFIQLAVAQGWSHHSKQAHAFHSVAGCASKNQLNVKVVGFWRRSLSHQDRWEMSTTTWPAYTESLCLPVFVWCHYEEPY